MKHIIREVPSDYSDLSLYFDDDYLKGKCGDYCTNLFIVAHYNYSINDGYNIKEYKRVTDKAASLLDGFSDVEDGCVDYDGKHISYKDVMCDNDIKYSPAICHKLKNWSGHSDQDDTDDIAELLTILTGKEWKAVAVNGYYQGDYCEVIYCVDCYTDQAAHEYGEVWLGCAKEFSLISLDDDGNEDDEVYGYIVADSKLHNEDGLKKLLCNMTGIDETEATVELIDDCYTTKHYKYRTI